MNDNVELMSSNENIAHKIGLGVYKQTPKNDIICLLCEGQHGNNTECQRND